MKKIFKDRDIRLSTKIKLVQTLVFPIFLYGAETWTIKKTDRAKIDAFELWCWRYLLGVNYLDRVKNTEIIKKINPRRMLESIIIQQSLTYFGHVMRANSMECQIMLGRMEGQRKRGRPNTTWISNIIAYTSKSIKELRIEARERYLWRMSVMDVARNRLRLDGTRYLQIPVSS